LARARWSREGELGDPGFGATSSASCLAKDIPPQMSASGRIADFPHRFIKLED
jgi:hypothetical protein